MASLRNNLDKTRKDAFNVGLLSRFIVDLTFVLFKRNLSLHHISFLLTYTTVGRLPLDIILLYNNQTYKYQMRLFQIKVLYLPSKDRILLSRLSKITHYAE